MADSTASTRLLARLRGHAALYSLLISIKRDVVGAWISLWRVHGVGVCMGAARGYYSGIDQLESEMKEGQQALNGGIINAALNHSHGADGAILLNKATT